MPTNYGKVRLFLFTNSYSVNKIAVYLKTKYKGRKLENAIRNLSVVLRFQPIQITNFVLFNIRPECPYQKIPKSIKLYLEIEKELLKLSEEKLDDYSTAIEDYQGQLLSPAIERAVGNFLIDVKNDNRFQNLLESNIGSAHYAYYKIAYKYCLPTIRTVPFILRLVELTNR